MIIEKQHWGKETRKQWLLGRNLFSSRLHLAFVCEELGNAMIDWVSIVRTSRRRFSSYKYIPGRIRKRKKKQAAAAAAAEAAAKVEPPPKPPPSKGCPCCYLSRVSGSRGSLFLSRLSMCSGLARTVLAFFSPVRGNVLDFKNVRVWEFYDWRGYIF